MIDIHILRDKLELLKSNCARRSCSNIDLDQLHALDQQYLKLVRQCEDMRAERNRLTKLCRDNAEAREQVRQLKQDLQDLEVQQKKCKADVDAKLAWLPNFLADDVPAGNSDQDNQLLREVGSKPQFAFTPLDHQALGEKLGIIDCERGAKVAQSGFYYWKGRGAQLASALFFWTQQQLISRGYTLFFTPIMAKETTLFGTGYLPFFADQTYKLENEDLALIGTSEQTLVGMHADEVLAANTLPRRYTAFTPCFRTESGSYGKETRGIFRVHQFHKVEQIVFCAPEDSPRYHLECLDNEEHLLQQLGIAYRVVNVCVGDLGAPGYKKFDIEAWFAGYNGYREVTSNTNLTDFQTRRLGIRYQGDSGKGFVHTISATAVTDRVVCAILENNQQADGSVLIPEVLQPLTGFAKIQAGDA